MNIQVSDNSFSNYIQPNLSAVELQFLLSLGTALAMKI